MNKPSRKPTIRQEWPSPPTVPSETKKAPYPSESHLIYKNQTFPDKAIYHVETTRVESVCVLSHFTTLLQPITETKKNAYMTTWT